MDQNQDKLIDYDELKVWLNQSIDKGVDDDRRAQKALKVMKINLDNHNIDLSKLFNKY